jgi:hypothetical protein
VEGSAASCAPPPFTPVYLPATPGSPWAPLATASMPSVAAGPDRPALPGPGWPADSSEESGGSASGGGGGGGGITQRTGLVAAAVASSGGGGGGGGALTPAARAGGAVPGRSPFGIWGGAGRRGDWAWFRGPVLHDVWNRGPDVFKAVVVELR